MEGRSAVIVMIWKVIIQDSPGAKPEVKWFKQESTAGDYFDYVRQKLHNPNVRMEYEYALYGPVGAETLVFLLGYPVRFEDESDAE